MLIVCISIHPIISLFRAIKQRDDSIVMDNSPITTLEGGGGTPLRGRVLHTPRPYP